MYTKQKKEKEKDIPVVCHVKDVYTGPVDNSVMQNNVSTNIVENNEIIPNTGNPVVDNAGIIPNTGNPVVDNSNSITPQAVGNVPVQSVPVENNFQTMPEVGQK